MLSVSIAVTLEHVQDGAGADAAARSDVVDPARACLADLVEKPIALLAQPDHLVRDGGETPRRHDRADLRPDRYFQRFAFELGIVLVVDLPRRVDEENRTLQSQGELEGGARPVADHQVRLLERLR